MSGVDQAAPQVNNVEIEKKKRKLSYKEKMELDKMASVIQAMEAEQAELTKCLGDGQLYKTSPQTAREYQERLTAIEIMLTEKFARWEYLDS